MIEECKHDNESIISLIEERGYSEEDVLACKLCVLEENRRLFTEVSELKGALVEIANCHLAYDEPHNPDFDALQDIAIAVLRDLYDSDSGSQK